MKQNELRIGNLITARYQDDYAVNQIVVNAISEIGVNRSYGETEFYIENCEPIPLTEEWVLKFGFKDLGYGEFEKGRYVLDKEYTDKGFWEFCILGKALPDMEVQYVHQLQNLYFALTGEELTH